MPDDSNDFYQTGNSEESNNGREEDAGLETALLPRSFFSGKELEPGKKCEIEIVSLMDGEAEVKYVPHKEKSEEKKEDKPDRDEAQESIDIGIENMRRT